MQSSVQDRRRVASTLVVSAVLGFLIVSAFTWMPSGAVESPDLGRFDTDTYPAIDVSHRFPSIAVASNEIELEFTFACGYIQPGDACDPTATLMVSYGGEFAPWPIKQGDRDSLIVHSANVPAADVRGNGLHYYLVVEDQKRGVSVRYPTQGALSPFVAGDVIDIVLDAPEAGRGDSTASFGWGASSRQVGLNAGPEQLTSGPEAIAISPDGSLIAVMDSVNGRVIVQDRDTGSVRPVGTSTRVGDIAIDDSGRLTVLDAVGTALSEDGPPIPRVTVFSASGVAVASGPVYVNVPSRITVDGEVHGIAGLDVRPLGSDSSPRSRYAQRATADETTLEAYFRHDGQVLLADREMGLAFRVTSTSGVGPIAMFERYDAGYALVMATDIGLEMVWFDTSGQVTSHLTTPRHAWADSSPTGRVGLDASGSIYVMNTYETGVEVLRFEEGQR